MSTNPYTEYVYQFGINDVKVQFGTYDDVAAYISKPYKINGNVTRVSLIAYEDHPVLSSDNAIISTRATSVEYYVANREFPALEAWIPILPKNIDKVYNELLFFDQTGLATLRFNAVPTTGTIYKNGVMIDKDNWTFTSNAKRVAITNNFNPSAQYTIDYIPINPYNIDFLDNTVVNYDETFNGTDRNMSVKLSYYPYIDYALINTGANYRPFTVYLENTDILGPDKKVIPTIGPSGTVYTENKTDYQTGSEITLTPYDPQNHPVFEYYQKGDRLYFTETFNKADLKENLAITHGNATIHVYYQTIMSTIRIKIILRKLKHPYNVNATPSVKEFSLEMITA